MILSPGGAPSTANCPGTGGVIRYHDMPNLFDNSISESEWEDITKLLGKKVEPEPKNQVEP